MKKNLETSLFSLVIAITGLVLVVAALSVLEHPGFSYFFIKLIFLLIILVTVIYLYELKND